MGILVNDPNEGGGGGGTPPVADTTLKRLALTPDALNGSSALSAMSITQTWNTTGAPTAFLVDITDTASDSGSLLANFKVGGASKMSLSKAGVLTVPAMVVNGGGNAVTITGNLTASSISNYPTFAIGYPDANKATFGSNLVFRWCSVNDYTGSVDLIIGRGGAAAFKLGADHPTTATTQTVKAHDVVTGTGANLVLAGGTGSVANGDVILDGENRAAFVADANALISFSGSDTVSLMTLESDFGALVSAFNALKATVISHGLMNPA